MKGDTCVPNAPVFSRDGRWHVVFGVCTWKRFVGRRARKEVVRKKKIRKPRSLIRSQCQIALSAITRPAVVSIREEWWPLVV